MSENLDPNWLGTEEEEIYKENILDHYKNPRNNKELSNPFIKHREFNPVCGDDLTIYLEVKDDVITDASFEGNGCAISIAAASMLTDLIKGKTLDQVKEIKREEIFEVLGISLGVVRMKCGLLSLKAVVKGINEKEIKLMEVKNDKIRN
jgi:nitrogen fixation protein NifU and related proteins